MEEWEAGKTFAVIEKQIKEGLNQLTTDEYKKSSDRLMSLYGRLAPAKTAAPEQVAGSASLYIGELSQGTMKTGLASIFPSFMGGALTRTTSANSWPSPISMVPWWGEPA